MMTNPMMSGPECQQVVGRLLLAFPNLAGDTERCQEVSRKMQQFPYHVALQAVEEYVNHGGDKFLELTRLLAVAYRIFREQKDREANIAKVLERRQERQHHVATSAQLQEADKFIAEMTDDDVMREWRPLLEQMVGFPREWAEQWPAAKVRTNVRFRMKVASLMQQKNVA
jgi:hypothetical protein